MITDVETLLSTATAVVALVNQLKAGNVANLPTELVNLATLARTDLAPAEAVISYLDHELAQGDGTLVIVLELLLPSGAGNAAVYAEGQQQALNAGNGG